MQSKSKDGVKITPAVNFMLEDTDSVSIMHFKERSS